MDSRVVCYDESRPDGMRFSRTLPLSLLHSFYEFNKARQNGSVITFITEGLDAERAMDVVKEMLEKPTNPAEALLEMVTGKPVSFPVPNKSFDEAVGDQLRAWGLHGIADERERERQRGA